MPGARAAMLNSPSDPDWPLDRTEPGVNSCVLLVKVRRNAGKKPYALADSPR
jgi:hypothetical protein